MFPHSGGGVGTKTHHAAVPKRYMSRRYIESVVIITAKIGSFFFLIYERTLAFRPNSSYWSNHMSIDILWDSFRKLSAEDS